MTMTDPDEMERVLREVAADAGLTCEAFMQLDGEEARAAFARSITKSHAKLWDAVARRMKAEAMTALLARAPEDLTVDEAIERGYITDAEVAAALNPDPEAVTARVEALDPPRDQA